MGLSMVECEERRFGGRTAEALAEVVGYSYHGLAGDIRLSIQFFSLILLTHEPFGGFALIGYLDGPAFRRRGTL